MILLITANEVIETAFVDSKNFNRSKIKDSKIYAAQYRWIKPVLGSALYDSLLGEVKNEALGTNNQMLLDDFIKPCLAYYVKYAAMPDLMLQLTNKGGQKATSQFSDSISTAERGEKREAAKQDANTYRAILADFLNDNKGLFPNYDVSKSKGKKSIRGGILLKKNRNTKNEKVSIIDTSNKKTYEYEANETGYFELDFSDIKATGEQISIVVKNSNGYLINQFDIDVNYDTANQTLEAWINTGNEADYSGTITVTVNK